MIITHGHQAEAANAFNYDHLFIDQAGPPVLNTWGSFFVLSVINRFKERRPHLDRVRPFAPYVIWALLFDFSLHGAISDDLRLPHRSNPALSERPTKECGGEQPFNSPWMNFSSHPP